MRAAIAIFAVIGIGIGLWAPVPKKAGPVAELVVAKPESASDQPQPSAPPPPPAETRIERGDNGHFYTFADINGTPTRFVVDTGATTVALTVEDAQRAGIAVDPASFQVVGTGASGDVRGQMVMIDTVSLDGRRTEGVQGAVLDGLKISLLGQSYLSRLDSVEIRNGTMKLR